jgi:hypothetical protein
MSANSISSMYVRSNRVTQATTDLQICTLITTITARAKSSSQAMDYFPAIMTFYSSKTRYTGREPESCLEESLSSFKTDKHALYHSTAIYRFYMSSRNYRLRRTYLVNLAPQLKDINMFLTNRKRRR